MADDDLIAFLRARYDEDEQVAREASRFPHDNRPMTPGGEHWHWVEPAGDQVITLNPVQDEYLNGGGQTALRSVEQYPTGNPWTLSHFVVSYAEEVRTTDAMHIARWDPARALAEVDAKRRILDRYEDAVARQTDPDYSARHADVQVAEYEDWILPALALPYADHPDYREEWRPSAATQR